MYTGNGRNGKSKLVEFMEPCWEIIKEQCQLVLLPKKEEYRRCFS